MISIIIPFHNEEENLPLLYSRLKEVLSQLKEDHEIIFIDDGSDDKSIAELKNKNGHIKLVSHRKRFGKGRALVSGFSVSSGKIIVLMDADLQDDPKEIPRFLSKINQGYDLVNGWRKQRNDPISKTLPSSIFNFFFLKLLFRSKFHDINCGFKALRREVLDQIPLYGDNYRFIPLIAEKGGFKTTEIPIHHHPRIYGKSKYGFFRMLFGFFDMIATYFVYEFSEKPIHFFGPVGILVFVIGLIITGVLLYQRIFKGMLLYRRPILNLGVLMIIVGIQIIMTGIIGELIVYFNKKNSK